MPKGRKKGQIVERKDNPKGYIIISKDIRVKVETDSLTIEEVTGKDAETQEVTYGNNKYFTSWKGLFDYLIRRFTTEKIGKKGMLTFIEGRKEILDAINELREILLGEINQKVKTSNQEIKNNIKKFNI